MVELTGERTQVVSAHPGLPGFVRVSLRFAQRKPLSAAGAVVLFFLVTLVVVGPLFIAGNPNVGSLREHLQPPSAKHLFGTDQLGRDLFTRVLYGGRLSLMVGIG